MPQSSLLRRLIMSNSLLLKSLTLPSSPHPWWPSAIPDTESTWLAAWCTEEMLSLRMWMLQLQPSRPREPSNSLIGAQLDSSAESTTSHQLLFQVVILPKSWEQSAWFPTPLPLLRSSPESITSSISCTPREPSSTGMPAAFRILSLVDPFLFCLTFLSFFSLVGTWEKVWRKVNSRKLVRTLLLLRRIMKKLVRRALQKVLAVKLLQKQPITLKPTAHCWIVLCFCPHSWSIFFLCLLFARKQQESVHFHHSFISQVLLRSGWDSMSWVMIDGHILSSALHFEWVHTTHSLILSFQSLSFLPKTFRCG